MLPNIVKWCLASSEWANEEDLFGNDRSEFDWYCGFPGDSARYHQLVCS